MKSKYFTKFELILWVGSMVLISMSFMMGSQKDILILCASLIGVSSLILLAKGNVLGQILIIIFSIFYGVISYQFRYYGEMITYIGMTLPSAIAATVSWLKHPYKKGKSQVEISSLNKTKLIILTALTIVVTTIFYFILKYFNTANLIISTVSVATSFAASSLTFLRSEYYAAAYACNDIVLIILWSCATLNNIIYLPMIICFVVFFINDVYGFLNWKKMKIKQDLNI